MSRTLLHEGFTPQLRTIGRAAAWAVFVLDMVYAVILVLGLFSLKSPQDPIGDPFFTLLEMLILLIALVNVIAMVAVHAYASPEVKVYSATALALMLLHAGLTSSVHFVILTVRRPLEATGLSWVSPLLSFTWPSVAYTLDILAWDWFFGLAMLFSAPVFKGGRLETAVRILMLASGFLSLAGLIGVPLADMQVRLIGVVGYVGVAPFAFLLLGVIFGRTRADTGLKP
jgi:hypothetical protein